MIKNLILTSLTCLCTSPSIAIEPKETNQVSYTYNDQSTNWISHYDSGNFPIAPGVTNPGFLIYGKNKTTYTVNGLKITNYFFTETGYEFNMLTNYSNINSRGIYLYTYSIIETTSNNFTYRGQHHIDAVWNIRDRQNRTYYKNAYIDNVNYPCKQAIGDDNVFIASIESLYNNANWEDYIDDINDDIENEYGYATFTPTYVNNRVTINFDSSQISPSESQIYVIATKVTLIQDGDINITNSEGYNTGESATEIYDSYKVTIDGNEQIIPNYNVVGYVNSRGAANITIENNGQIAYEVIDIGSLMWDIIGMPFSFINQAFNVTLFEGTIYQFNIGNLFKGMIAILSILFVVKLFTHGIDVLGSYNNTIGEARDKREDRQWKHEERQMKREKHAKEMNE